MSSNKRRQTLLWMFGAALNLSAASFSTDAYAQVAVQCSASFEVKVKVKAPVKSIYTQTYLPVTLEFAESVRWLQRSKIFIKSGRISDLKRISKSSGNSVYSFRLIPTFGKGKRTAKVLLSLAEGAGKSQCGGLSRSTVPFEINFHKGALPKQTPTPGTSPSKTATPKITPTKQVSPTNTPVSSPTLAPTKVPTTAPTSTSTPRPTATSVPQATATPLPSATATSRPTNTSTPLPSPTTTSRPSSTPTPRPTSPSVATATPISSSCNAELSTQVNRLPAFPGAVGHGAMSFGGSGRHLRQKCSQIFKVTSLADSGPGTLRECVSAQGPRTCVFETSGIIDLKGKLINTNPYLTIAGQTAPSPGIMLRGAPFINKASNVLVQHLRIRIGDKPTANPVDCDPFSVTGSSAGPVENVVYDHVSSEFGLDEGMSVVAYDGDITGVTISNSIIAMGLDMSVHPEASDPTDPGHSKGVIVKANSGRAIDGITFYRNLIAHNVDRNIRYAADGTLEFVNNVVYNWGRGKGVGLTLETAGSGQYPKFWDIIGNYYKPGLDTFCPTTLVRPERCTAPQGVDGGAGGEDTPEERLKMHYILRPGGMRADNRYFLSRNIGTTRPTDSGDEWLIADRGFFSDSARTTLIYPSMKASAPVASSGLTALSAEQAFPVVLSSAGARPKDRDAIDLRVAQDAANGTGRVINCVVDDGSERCKKNFGGWPDYPTQVRSFSVPADPFGDSDGDGYTNLEEVLQEMAKAVE